MIMKCLIIIFFILFELTDAYVVNEIDTEAKWECEIKVYKKRFMGVLEHSGVSYVVKINPKEYYTYYYCNHGTCPGDPNMELILHDYKNNNCPKFLASCDMIPATNDGTLHTYASHGHVCNSDTALEIFSFYQPNLEISDRFNQLCAKSIKWANSFQTVFDDVDPSFSGFLKKKLGTMVRSPIDNLSGVSIYNQLDETTRLEYSKRRSFQLKSGNSVISINGATPSDGTKTFTMNDLKQLFSTQPITSQIDPDFRLHYYSSFSDLKLEAKGKLLIISKI